MMNVSRKEWIAFLLWLFIVPTFVYIGYSDFPYFDIDYGFIIVNFVMLIIAMSVVFQISSVNLSVERWIIFVVFFQYGFFAEMIFMQFALLLSQFLRKSNLPAFYRFTTNSLMFGIVSIISATTFHLVGGRLTDMSTWGFVVAALVYALSYSFFNSFVLYLMLKLEKTSADMVKKISIWDFTMTMIVLPLAIAYSLLTDIIGAFSVLLLGAPFLFILLIIRKFAFSDELNNKLSSAVEIGHELTESLKTSEVVKVFTKKLRDVVNYDQAYILDVRHGNELLLLVCSEAGSISSKAEFFEFHSDAFRTLSTTSIETFKSNRDVQSLEHLKFSSAVQSVMTAPILRAGRVEGFVVLTSFRKNFFEELDKKMVGLLNGYFETSIMKAFHYEQTIAKSEVCGLTKLSNYRYLKKQLREEMNRFENKELETLSTIIMDIDHFKSINDTYGHQSGNEILIEFAKLLKKYETEGSTLARYGGEEFVLLLPDLSKEEAIRLAEGIRTEVETHLFRITSDLSEDYQSTAVHVTVSLGVSSIPEDTQSENSLLRNADRALYIGGKQAGRNRVGVYEADGRQAVEI
ncbi:sensor domain-containing diguanylate cyclase [Sporosarcina aquimarina]|uniref:GGDEF domain-containing protein n=1 Tax=Sporosarcina aquimarina TaxID=114975 RepID=A0ABU4FY66_9BACL|nr:GGDEF domain-containing protein [Sporosarcina aquimarina]MDW0109653.1 GGDEF domain-containing protein [Sporosarcina aquimarina]